MGGRKTISLSGQLSQIKLQQSKEPPGTRPREQHPRRIMNDANEHEKEEFEDMLDDDVVPLEEGMLLGDPAELFWGRQDDEDDDLARHREESRRQVEQNDPSLLSIDVGSDEYDYMPRNGNWEASGASFGRNTHIKEILISLNSTQMGVHFFSRTCLESFNREAGFSLR